MRIAIIGAGVGGLTAAYELKNAGHDVTVFEQGEKPGGLASGFKKDGWEWSLEKYYHHWFTTDKSILSLIDELGLSEKVLFYKPKTVVYHKGGFYPLDSAIAVLKFPGFSLVNKLRFGFITFALKYLLNWKPLEQFTAVEWIKRWYGKKLYDVFFEPLLSGKFSNYYKDVTMAWMWARFKARSAKLGTFKGGFQEFLDQFAGKLLKLNIHFYFNTRVTQISSLKNGKLELTYSDHKTTFDQVLVTVSPKILSRITPQLKGNYLASLNAQKSIGAITVILSLKHPLSKEGFYWFNLPKSAGFPFLALVEHTNYISSNYYNGEHLIYCGDYLEKKHPYFSMSDAEITNLLIPSLKKVNPSFSQEWINSVWVFKTPYAQPIPLINHSQNLLDIKTPLPGLFLASMSQVYPWDRGTNYAVSLAQKAVQLMNEI